MVYDVIHLQSKTVQHAIQLGDDNGNNEMKYTIDSKVNGRIENVDLHHCYVYIVTIHSHLKLLISMKTWSNALGWYNLPKFIVYHVRPVSIELH